jgi:hypothetical protein
MSFKEGDLIYNKCDGTYHLVKEIYEAPSTQWGSTSVIRTFVISVEDKSRNLFSPLNTYQTFSLKWIEKNSVIL